MSLVKWAIFGLLLLPFTEIAVFVAVALKIGVLAALALTILTSLAGMAIIRRAGRGEVERVRTALGEQVLTRVVVDGPGILTVFAGFLLLLPGFLTDVLGILLLLPVSRRLIHATLRRATRAVETPGAPGVVDLEPGQWRQVPEQRIARRDADQMSPNQDKP
jgi:UPF0716 protein FxsA